MQSIIVSCVGPLSIAEIIVQGILFFRQLGSEIRVLDVERPLNFMWPVCARRRRTRTYSIRYAYTRYSAQTTHARARHTCARACEVTLGRVFLFPVTLPFT